LNARKVGGGASSLRHGACSVVGMISRFLPFCFVASLAACGGQTSVDPGTDGAVDGATDSATDTAVVDTGTDVAPDTSPGGCPATQPFSGPCSPVGLECGYGDDPRPGCRPVAKCTSSGWSSGVGACPPPPTTTCPTTLADAEGKACTVIGAYCTYGERTCGCGNCFGGPCGTDAKWVCDPKNDDPACPAKLPNLGVACTKAGSKCTYGSCAVGNIAGRECKGGVWVDVPMACPV